MLENISYKSGLDCGSRRSYNHLVYPSVVYGGSTEGAPGKKPEESRSDRRRGAGRQNIPIVSDRTKNVCTPRILQVHLHRPGYYLVNRPSITNNLNLDKFEYVEPIARFAGRTHNPIGR